MPWLEQDIMSIHLLWCSGRPGYKKCYVTKSVMNHSWFAHLLHHTDSIQTLLHHCTTSNEANVDCNHAPWLQTTNCHTHNVSWHASGLPAVLVACGAFCSSATDLSKSLASFRSETGMKICNNRANHRAEQNFTGFNIHCKEQIPKELSGL